MQGPSSNCNWADLGLDDLSSRWAQGRRRGLRGEVKITQPDGAPAFGRTGLTNFNGGVKQISRRLTPH